MTRARRTGRGQAMVEFALIAPIFFLVLFAIVEGGRFMFYYEALNHATREGARYAIVNGANSLGCPTGPPAPNSTPCDTAGDDVVDRVRSSAYGMPPSSIAVVPTWNPNNGRGSIVNVQASLTYSTLVPLLPLPPITVTAESSLVVNN
jgi:TadE-like protein